jgi:DNA polymerase
LISGKAGLYKYAQSEDFEILLFAYSFDDEPVKVISLAEGEQLPQELVTALSDPDIIKTAYNASFEWYCLNKFWKSPIEQWRCTMARGLYCGYPAGLSAIGNALGLSEDKKKLASGKALIRYFCMPCKATKTNRRQN